MPDRRQTGRAGEAEAAAYLSECGYRILARNYRTTAGEIDIVAEEGETLVFVEVKTRSGLGRGLPREAVDRGKIRRMTRAAYQYLAGQPEERPCRFDVVEVVLVGGAAEVFLIRNAFPPDERALPW